MTALYIILHQIRSITRVNFIYRSVTISKYCVYVKKMYVIIVCGAQSPVILKLSVTTKENSEKTRNLWSKVSSEKHSPIFLRNKLRRRRTLMIAYTAAYAMALADSECSSLFT